MQSHLLCCWKRMFSTTSAFSWPNSISLCPSSFCTPRPNLPVTPGLLNSCFYIPVPYDEKDIFSLVLVLEVFIELFNFHFSLSYWGIDLDYCDTEWFALESIRDHSVAFETVAKYCISNSFVDYEGYSISSKGFLPTVVDILVIWIKFFHLRI